MSPMAGLSPIDFFGLVLIEGGLLAFVFLLSAAPVLMAFSLAHDRAAIARAVRGQHEQPGEEEPAFWCWQAVVAYLIVLWIAKEALTFFGFDPHREPVPFLIYGLGLGLGLTFLDKWYRGRRSKRQLAWGRK